MKPAGPDAARLLRWYPRAWRQRYGEEFLAMVEDWLDGGRPGWRLRLSVARAGLRERSHRARLAGQEGLRRAFTGKLSTLVLAGYLLVVFPFDFKAAPPPARAWQATTALAVLTGTVVCTVAAVLAGGLVAVPAFARYLRAGGWPEIRRRIAWAAGATVAAGGALAGLLLASMSRTYSQLNGWGAYFAGVLATTLALAVAVWLWSAAVPAMAKRLDLTPRVRTAEKRLGAVAAFSATMMIPVFAIWLSAIQSSVFLLFLGLSIFAMWGLGGYMTIRRAARSARGR